MEGETSTAGGPGLGDLFGQIWGDLAPVAQYGLKRAIDAEFMQPFTVDRAQDLQLFRGWDGQLFQSGQPASPGVAAVIGSPLFLVGAAVLGVGLLVYLLKD